MKFKLYLIGLLLMTVKTVQSQSLINSKLIDSIEKIIEAKMIPGGAITVVTKDSILFQTVFGYSDLEYKIKIRNDNTFKIASLTKTFTNMAIMRLVNEGSLSLEDELKIVAPEIPFKNKWEETHPIKIKHLIEHKSGFGDYSYAQLATRYEGIYGTASYDRVLSLKNTFKSHWKPGLVTSYSNPGYVILGYIIEKKTGMAYNDYIENHILRPLKMTTSGFNEFSKTNEKNLTVCGYTKIDSKIVKTDDNKPSLELGSTGLRSNANDMAKFLQYLLNENEQQTIPLIGTSGVEEMEKLHSDFDVANNIRTGYNMALEDRIFGDKEIVFKGNSGLTDGFVSNFIYNRELDIGVFVCTNLFGVSNREIIDLVINQFCGSKEVISDYQLVNGDLSRFKDWEGEHRELNDTHEIWNFINFPFRSKSVRIEGDELLISDIENGEYTYKNVGGNAFLNEEYGETIPTVYLTEYQGTKSLRYYDSTFLPTNKIYYTVLRLLLVFSLFVLIITAAIFIYKAIAFLFNKSNKTSLFKTFKFVLPFLIIVFSIYLTLINSSFDRIPNLGLISITSIVIYVLTLAYPLTCIWLIYAYLKEKKKSQSLYSRTFWSLVLFANIFICSYCASMGWFAVRFWI